MKKLFFLAATAMLFAACTNEEGVNLQNEKDAPEGVTFDVYVPSSTNTRAGRSNVMNTSTMQKTGFGVFAYWTDNVPYSYDIANPNFMWNQQVDWNSKANGWYYAPLKYWPNETDNDSQVSPAEMPISGGSNIDRLTFLAYAPWVDAYPTTGLARPVDTDAPANLLTPNNVGITYITNNEGKLAKKPKDNSDGFFDVNDGKIWYEVATNPNQSVDLLWGVAPVGGISYTSVAKDVTAGTALSAGVVTIPEGMPLVDFIKPAVNTNLKIMFQHALARLGVKIVAAVDNVTPTSTSKLDIGNTKITVESIKIYGNFATKGILNLKNTAPNTALWSDQEWANTLAKAFEISEGRGLAKHLCYDSSKNPASGEKSQQEVTGVTTTLADAIQVANVNHADYNKLNESPKYNPTTPFFTTIANSYAQSYVTFAGWSKTDGQTYLHRYVANDGVVSYTDITSTIRADYPYATVWEDIYNCAGGCIHQVLLAELDTYKGYTAYRKKGNTYYATNDAPIAGDYVFTYAGAEIQPGATPKPDVTSGTKYYQAVPNYFMIIPGNSGNKEDLNVKITYYVSTADENLKDKVVYVKNEVEQKVTLPHLKNGSAYNLKITLGLTSVKLDAEVADWETTNAEVNLPQNISE